MDSRALYFAFGVAIAIAVMLYRGDRALRQCLTVVDSCCEMHSCTDENHKHNGVTP